MNAKERKKAAERFEAQQKARRLKQRVRRLAIERLRWTKVALSDMPAEAKDQRLHEIEIKQRQVKGALWRSIPDSHRWVGKGTDKHQVHKDADRWAGIRHIEAEADKMLQARRDRRHPPKPPSPPNPDAKHYGPFDIELDDLDWLIGGDIHTSIQRLSARQERMTKPVTYRPDGSIASGPPAIPPVPQAPVAPTSRPAPPPIPPVSIEAAEEFEIPFGKHRGMTIGYLLGDRETIGYLQWLCTKAEIKSPKFAEALQVVYQHYEGEIDSRTPPEETAVRYNPPRAAPSTPPTLYDEDDIPF